MRLRRRLRDHQLGGDLRVGQAGAFADDATGRRLRGWLILAGFGVGGPLRGDPGFVVTLWAAVAALCTASAVLWLRRFERGPLELVLHRVTDRVAVAA